jgi:hypothetical protein
MISRGGPIFTPKRLLHRLVMNQSIVSSGTLNKITSRFYKTMAYIILSNADSLKYPS